MTTFFLALTIFIALLFAASLYRILTGPTVYDRAIGAGLIGTNAILILVLIGFIYQRIDMFVDLALAYGMLNFIGVVALAKYFERKQDKV
ncbi:MAG: monovalent cation/H+ antiporter complex subunit F [Deltaproteobacteria bacterium]|nr:monovalent cation/H+ antiporter complex subunit F [Deltaproteobacteria bacterium]MDZ4343744.1 monovalent cation/H+ antiporter complex subunit F [Candidatus Binatia bacterium]